MYMGRRLYSFVYTNSNESGFHQIFVFKIKFPYLISIVTLHFCLISDQLRSGKSMNRLGLW